MNDMGRPKSAWLDLPPRMAARKLVSGKVLYYYQAQGKKIPLGSNLLTAKQEWARLESGAGPVLFPQVANKYRAATFGSFSVSTKDHYERALRTLEVSFRKFALEQITPKDVKDYMKRRTKKGAAMFEKRVLSAMYSWAREEGITSAPNPCSGVKFSKVERKTYKIVGRRTHYVTGTEFDETHARGDEAVQDTMDLALYGGQRPSDILKAMRQDVKDGVWRVEQQKTGKVVLIRVEGELQRVIERILARKRPSMYLISNESGERLTYEAFRRRFTKARDGATWQFRDIRAKAASDSDTLKDGQLLLGHENERTTAASYRRSSKDAVSPLKRKI